MSAFYSPGINGGGTTIGSDSNTYQPSSSK
jgi:hypothetical protein